MGNSLSNLSNVVNADSLVAKADDSGRLSADSPDYQQQGVTEQVPEKLPRTSSIRPRIIEHPHSEPVPLRPRSSRGYPATSGLITADDDLALIKKSIRFDHTPLHSDRVLRSSRESSNYRNTSLHGPDVGTFGKFGSTVSLEHENSSWNSICQSFNNLEIEDDVSTDTDDGIGDNTSASSIMGNPFEADHTFIQRRDSPNFLKYKNDLSTMEVDARIIRCLVEPAITRSILWPNYRMKDGCIYVMRILGHPGYVKIGLTTRQPAERLWDHLRCGYNIDSEFFEVSCCQKIETIVHMELHNQRHGFSCSSCGKKHDEWFKMDYQKAKNTVQKWCRWMEEEPYGADNALTSEWQERISGGVRDILGF